MSNVGRWLDRGINKLMGAPEGAHPAHQQSTAMQPPAVMSQPGVNAAQGAAPPQGPAGVGGLSHVAPGAIGGPGMLSNVGQADAVNGAGYRRSASETDFQKVDHLRDSLSNLCCPFPDCACSCALAHFVTAYCSPNVF